MKRLQYRQTQKLNRPTASPMMEMMFCVLYFSRFLMASVT